MGAPPGADLGFAAIEVDESGPGRWPATNLVVGVERSATSMAALGKGAEIGCLLGSGIRAVHAVDLSDYPSDPDADDWEEQAKQALDEERAAVARALAGYPGAWSFMVVSAEPTDALVAAALRYKALMIVVGARCDRRPRLEHMGHRPLSQRLIGRAPCPVLVVPQHRVR